MKSTTVFDLEMIIYEVSLTIKLFFRKYQLEPTIKTTIFEI